MDGASEKSGALVRAGAGLVLGGVGIFGPYFGLRIPSSSFSLVDAVLSIGVLVGILSILYRGREAIEWVVARCGVPVAVGLAFFVVGALSGYEGLFRRSGEFQFGSFLAVVGQYGFLMIGIPVFAARWLTIRRVDRYLRLVAIGYLGPMCATVIVLLLRAPGGVYESFFNAGRAIGTYGNANAYACVIVTTLPVYMTLTVGRHRTWRWVGYAGLLMCMVNLILTLSFGGGIILIVVFLASVSLAFVWRLHPLRDYFRKIVMGGFWLAAAIVLLGWGILQSPWAAGQARDRFASIGEADTVNIRDLGSASLRIELIDEAMRMIAERGGGIWGHGMGQSRRFSRYEYEVHFTYLLLWIEGGGVSMALFIVFLGILFRNSIRLAQWDPGAGFAAGLGLLALVVYACLQPHLYMRYFWLPVLPSFVGWPRLRCGS